MKSVESGARVCRRRLAGAAALASSFAAPIPLWSRRGRLAKQVPGGVIRACIVIRAERGAPFFGPVIWIHSIGPLCLTRMEERARMYAMFALRCEVVCRFLLFCSSVQPARVSPPSSHLEPSGRVVGASY